MKPVTSDVKLVKGDKP